MKVDGGFARESYSQPSAVRGYSGAVRRIGLWKFEQAFLSRHLPAGGRLLDLGCGAGRTTFALHQRGWRNILGADLCPAMIREARGHAARRGLAVRFRVADACRLPFPSASFEGCLFSFNGLMTIPGRARRVAALREIRRILVPGGRFVFTTHDRRHGAGSRLRWRKERALWRRGGQDPQLHEFGDEMIEELGRPTFVHVPDRREVLEDLRSAGLERVADEISDLARESSRVRAFVGSDCRFWAVRRRP